MSTLVLSTRVRALFGVAREYVFFSLSSRQPRALSEASISVWRTLSARLTTRSASDLLLRGVDGEQRRAWTLDSCPAASNLDRSGSFSSRRSSRPSSLLPHAAGDLSCVRPNSWWSGGTPAPPDRVEVFGAGCFDRGRSAVRRPLSSSPLMSTGTVRRPADAGRRGSGARRRSACSDPRARHDDGWTMPCSRMLRASSSIDASLNVLRG